MSLLVTGCAESKGHLLITVRCTDDYDSAGCDAAYAVHSIETLATLYELEGLDFSVDGAALEVTGPVNLLRRLAGLGLSIRY